jgi:HPt (histidine-containing phosphotransfer) domain-containing protein
MLMSSEDDDLEALVAGMRGPFLRTAGDRLTTIRAASSDLALALDPVPRLTLIVREAHTLKGGGAAFGFPSLGKAAAEVEALASALLRHPTPLPPLDDLHAAVARLDEVLRAAHQA